MTRQTDSFRRSKDTDKIVEQIEQFISKYLTFYDDIYLFPLALWCIGTYLWPTMDAYPYLVITASTKRAGKSRLAECMSFCCSNPAMSGAMGSAPASIFKFIHAEHPTMFFDEAENMSGEGASNTRSVLNMGYRKGQSVIRVTGKGNVESYDVYCPKVFILIGDMFDTVRDRSIIVRMKRGEAPTRFQYEIAKMEGEALRPAIEEITEEKQADFLKAFEQHEGLDFLNDRDEEIWMPLFCMAQVLCPERIPELRRKAVDAATEKTAVAMSYVNMLGEEQKEEDDEMARHLLRDLYRIVQGHKAIASIEVIEKLYAIDTAPWRRFRGEGLTPVNMSDLLCRFRGGKGALRPVAIRDGSKVFKGYRTKDVEKAWRSL